MSSQIYRSSRSQTKSTLQSLPHSLSDRSTARSNQAGSKRQLDDIELEILSKLEGGNIQMNHVPATLDHEMLLSFVKSKINVNK